MNAAFVVLFELLIRFFHELFHFSIEFFHLGITLILCFSDHLIDLTHLIAIPFDLWVRVVTSLFEKDTLIKHFIILVN